ncbi:hypothetical protein ABPG72_017531 [Tetrahymena utriculariae]
MDPTGSILLHQAKDLNPQLTPLNQEKPQNQLNQNNFMSQKKLQTSKPTEMTTYRWKQVRGHCPPVLNTVYEQTIWPALIAEYTEIHQKDGQRSPRANNKKSCIFPYRKSIAAYVKHQSDPVPHQKMGSK